MYEIERQNYIITNIEANDYNILQHFFRVYDLVDPIRSEGYYEDFIDFPEGIGETRHTFFKLGILFKEIFPILEHEMYIHGGNVNFDLFSIFINFSSISIRKNFLIKRGIFL